MATKAGRVQIRDIRAGRTFWKAAIIEGRRVPEQVFIVVGARLGSFKKANGTWTAIWHYTQRATASTPDYFGPLSMLLCDPMWTPRIDNEPIFDKLFINRAACVRWIRRYESNRIETLCEDRRVFECGSRPLRAIAAMHPDQLDLAQVLDHRFQHTELGLARYFGAHRRATIMETPNG